MKRVFFFIALALMLASCASTRKVQEATTTVSVESASVQETTCLLYTSDAADEY